MPANAALPCGCVHAPAQCNPCGLPNCCCRTAAAECPVLQAGSTACATLAVVLGLIDTALLNNDKICDLVLRAVNLQDIVVESQLQFEAQAGAFVRIMSRFNDC